MTTVSPHELQSHNRMFLPFQSNHESLIENSMIRTNQYQQTSGLSLNSDDNDNSDSATGFSGLDATLGLAPGDEFFSYGAFDGTGEDVTETAFDNGYGPFMSAQSHYKYERYPGF